MKSIKNILKMLDQGEFDNRFKSLYGKGQIGLQVLRYKELLSEFMEYYKIGKNTNVFIVSAPGRTEIGGNHTDHQNGQVLTGAINLDAIGVVALNNEDFVVVKSEGHKEDRINLDDLKVVKEDKNTSLSLLRGVLEGVKNSGFEIGGFFAYTKSDVLKGSGLSSSAAFEVLLCNMLNHGYNRGEISPVVIAKISQYAENHHFLKPSGLLDQMASSVGGFTQIDFSKREPEVKKINYRLEDSGYTLCIVDTGGDHADLTEDYASIPKEMREVAAYFNKNLLSEVKEEDFLLSLKDIREKLGDRPVLRSLHFFGENKRVSLQAKALNDGNFTDFLSLINQSGRSSFDYLQNVSTFKEKNVQNIPLALGVTDRFLESTGAFRVHGGGFAGTILAFIPNEKLIAYKKLMEDVFGQGACHELSIRREGGILVEPNKD